MSKGMMGNRKTTEIEAGEKKQSLEVCELWVNHAQMNELHLLL